MPEETIQNLAETDKGQGFLKFHRKTPALEFHCNKVTGPKATTLRH